MSSLRPSILGALLGFAAALVALLFDRLGTFRGFEGFTYDMRVRAMAPTVDVPVKIIVLDQGSLDWGKSNGWSWPWSRQVYPLMLSFLQRGGAKAVAFDVVFLEPHDDLPGDLEFAAAVGEMPNFVGAVIPSNKVGDAVDWPGKHVIMHEVAGLDEWLKNHPHASIDVSRAALPYAELQQATRRYGHVRAVDSDSVVRRAFPIQQFAGGVFLRLGLETWAAGAGHEKIPLSIDGSTLRIGDHTMQLDSEGASLLHYYRPRDVVIDGKTQRSSYAFEVFSVADVMASEAAIQEGEKPKLSPEVFKDCYVLFGFSAAALYDLKPTPFSLTTPGVELQATSLANLLRGDTMSFASPTLSTLFTLLWSAIVGAVTARGGKWWWLAGVATVALGVPVLIGVALYPAGYWWPIITPMAATALSVTAGIVFIYTSESKQRRYLRSAFSRYLSNEVIDRLLENPDQLKLGGEMRELSIFFSDVKGFSTISERLGAEKTTTLLNELLSEIAQIILSEGGTLDKYMGDGVMAFWNAPLEQPDHAVRAVRTALRCQRRFAERQDHFRNLAGGMEVEVRIGINTGTVLVGNLGSPERFDYSVMGDDANLAARLEGANKAFGTHILASLETWSRTNGQFKGRTLGRVMVVGRETPVQIVEPICFANEPLPPSAERFIAAIAMVGEGRVEQAIAQLEALSEDPVAAAFVKYLKTLDPKQVLDGVWRLTSK